MNFIIYRVHFFYVYYLYCTIILTNNYVYNIIIMLGKVNSVEDNRNNGGMHLFLGIIIIGIGLFMLLQQTDVTMSFASFRLGSWGVPSGLIIVPLLVGVIMMFYNSKFWLARVVTALGGVIIVAAIIMSTTIRFRTTSMYNYVIIILFIAAGAGLILRSLFKNRKNKKDE